MGIRVQYQPKAATIGAAANIGGLGQYAKWAADQSQRNADRAQRSSLALEQMRHSDRSQERSIQAQSDRDQRMADIQAAQMEQSQGYKLDLMDEQAGYQEQIMQAQSKLKEAEASYQYDAKEQYENKRTQNAIGEISKMEQAGQLDPIEGNRIRAQLYSGLKLPTKPKPQTAQESWAENTIKDEAGNVTAVRQPDGKWEVMKPEREKDQSRADLELFKSLTTQSKEGGTTPPTREAFERAKAILRGIETDTEKESKQKLGELDAIGARIGENLGIKEEVVVAKVEAGQPIREEEFKFVPPGATYTRPDGSRWVKGGGRKNKGVKGTMQNMILRTDEEGNVVNDPRDSFNVTVRDGRITRE